MKTRNLKMRTVIASILFIGMFFAFSLFESDAGKISRAIEKLDNINISGVVVEKAIEWCEDDMKNHSHILNLEHAVFNARHAFLNSMLPWQKEQYFQVAYAAWTANEGKNTPADIGWYGESYYKGAGVSSSLDKLLKKFRAMAMKRVKEKLSNPKELWQLYVDNKSQILKKARNYNNTDSAMQVLIQSFSGVDYSSHFFKTYEKKLTYDDIIRNLHAEEYNTKRKLQAFGIPYGETIIGSKWVYFLNGAVADSTLANNQIYLMNFIKQRQSEVSIQFKAINETLKSCTPSVYFSGFAYRRWKEGGDDLVNMYVKIFKDIQKSI